MESPGWERMKMTDDSCERCNEINGSECPNESGAPGLETENRPDEVI